MNKLLKKWKEELKELKKQRKGIMSMPLSEYELRRDEVRKEFAFITGKGAILEQCIKDLEEIIESEE